MPARDLYEVLELSPEADEGEIRRAYQKLARRYHPDIRPGDADAATRFDEVWRAFEVLSDPELRHRYDAVRREEGQRAATWFARWSESEEVLAGGGGTWVRTSRKVEVGGGDFPAPATAEEQGLARAEVELSFGEMVQGSTRSFPLQREHGCPDCGGSGQLKEDDAGARGSARPCSGCSGRGTIIELERVRVRIPRGIESGTRLRLSGKGPPLGPGRQGDLLITVRVQPHPYFRREGSDIHAELPLTLAEAILGGEVEVPTVGGRVKVKIPPVTQGGRRIRLRGRGLLPSGGESGDHYCHVVVTVPSADDPGVREFLSNLQQPDPRRSLPSEVPT